MVLRVPQATKDLLVLWVCLVKEEPQVLMELKVVGVTPDLLDLKEMPVSKEREDLKALLDLLDPLVKLVALETQDLLEQLEKWEPLA